MRYEFCCESCGDVFEMDLDIEDRDMPLGNVCVICEGKIKRLLSPTSFKVNGANAAGGYSINKKDIDLFKKKCSCVCEACETQFKRS